MRKIITVTWEFDPGDRVIYTGPVPADSHGRRMIGTVIGEAESGVDYLIVWDGWTDPDDVAKSDVRPVEQP